MTKPRGVRNYTEAERQRLLDIIAARLPVHQDEWAAVATAYNASSDLNWRSRDAASLKRKFTALYVSARGAKVSDTGGCHEATLAAQLRQQIARRAKEEGCTPTHRQMASLAVGGSQGAFRDAVTQNKDADALGRDQAKPSGDREHSSIQLPCHSEVYTTDTLLAWLQQREVQREARYRVMEDDKARVDALKRERRAEDLRDTDRRHRELMDSLSSLKYTLKRLKASSS